MYWYNLRALEKEITDNKFTDKEAFYYFLAFAILGVITGSFESDSETASYIRHTKNLLILIITIWGCYAIFKANSNGDGKDFFKRFFALAWVVGFRLFLLLLLVLIPLTFIYVIISSQMEVETSLYGHVSKDLLGLLAGTAFQILFFVLLRKSFERVSNN